MYRGLRLCCQITSMTRLVIPQRQLSVHTTLHSKSRKKSEVTAANHFEHHKELQTDEADVFGTLASKSPEVFSIMGSDPDDLDDNDGENEYQAKIADSGRPRPFDYLIKMEKLLNKGSKDVKSTGAANLKEALTLLDVEMKKECVKPKSEHFRILIHACGRAGYFEKAFTLYREHESRGYSPNFGIFADLFNACANTPDILKDRALIRASRLRKNLSDHYTLLPKPVYHTMIKAFGRCGDLESAFDIMDVMIEQKHLVDSETINHLLMGCIADKEAGFRHALIVWRRIRLKKIKLNIFSYNLMIRAAKECNAGPVETFPDLIIESIGSGEELKAFKIKLIEAQKGESKKKHSNEQQQEGVLVLVDDVAKQITDKMSLPNFLAPKPNMKNIFGIGDLSTPKNRLELLGGVAGLINVATKVDNVNINIKTFSQLLFCIEETIEAEEDLIDQIRRLNIKTDIDFFNQLIGRRARRGDIEEGRKLVEILSQEFGHSPNIMTFGVLAMCCSNLKTSFELLNEMKECGFYPNAEIVNTLLHRAAKRRRPRDVHLLLKEFQKRQLKPGVKTIQILEKFYSDFQQQIVSAEKKNGQVKAIILSEVEQGLKNWNDFIHFYKDWLKRTEMEMPEHPWKQYLTAKDIELAKKGKTFLKSVI